VSAILLLLVAEKVRDYGGLQWITFIQNFVKSMPNVPRGETVANADSMMVSEM